MVRGRTTRVGFKFNMFIDDITKELSTIHGEKVTKTRVTDELAMFLKNEDIVPILMRRAHNKRQRRRLF